MFIDSFLLLMMAQVLSWEGLVVEMSHNRGAMSVPSAAIDPLPAPRTTAVDCPEAMISVVMIVRDAAHDIVQALASVAWADEVVVYDTGSTDGTGDIAAQMGAHVLYGHWEDDFSRARNAALAAARHAWVLSLDADERAVLNEDALRERLCQAWADGVLGMSVVVHNRSSAEDDHAYAHPAPRLFQRAAMSWVGAVHEQPMTSQGPYAWVPLDRSVLALDHFGYQDPVVARAKAKRNVDIVLSQLDHAFASGELSNLSDLLLELGRGYIAAGDLQAAVEALENVREFAPQSSRPWVQATDFLARLLLADGQDQVVLVLAEQLETAGVEAPYVAWLRGQALAYLGQPDVGLELLRGIDELVDPAGRIYDFGRVMEMRSLVAELAGHRAEAVSSLTVAMVRYGRISGRVERLLALWEPSAIEPLARAIGEQGDPVGFASSVALELPYLPVQYLAPAKDLIAELQKHSQVPAPARPTGLSLFPDQRLPENIDRAPHGFGAPVTGPWMR